MIGQIPPDQRGYENREKNQDTSHGRGSLLAYVRLRPIGLDDLADLHLTQFFDDKWAEKKTD